MAFYEYILYCDDLEEVCMRKIICDCCGEEIDTTYKEQDWDMKAKSHLRVFGDKKSKIDGEISDLEYDLCDFCTKKVVDLIKNCG